MTLNLNKIPEKKYNWSHSFFRKTIETYITQNNKIGLCNRGGGLGDNVYMTNLPENFYYKYNKKLHCITNSELYRFNPYCEFQDLDNCDLVIDGYDKRLYFSNYYIQVPIFDELPRTSLNNQWFYSLGINEYVRQPRLYVFEDCCKKLNQLVLHPAGKSCGELSDFIIDYILGVYNGWKVFIIGDKKGKYNKYDQFSYVTDMRDAGLWKTIKTIAESSIFIGVNSGFMHVANCYDSVKKKIILNFDNEKDFLRFRPLCGDTPNSYWIDIGFEYFNTLEYDCGATKSYLRI